MKTKLYVVGIGPGNYEGLTLKAMNVLNKSDVIVGYTVYADLMKNYFPDKEWFATPMRMEKDRCRRALDNADQGKITSVICSGDAGIYGMAGLVLELAESYNNVDVEIVAGVSAVSSGAAVLGAPLMHDFCCISLSDQLTPWEKIERRLNAAAEGDFVICLYNPSSKSRLDHLKKACKILLNTLNERTVCGVVKNIGRDGQMSEIMTLDQLADYDADMFTTVFIGNETTTTNGMTMLTKRGYQF